MGISISNECCHPADGAGVVGDRNRPQPSHTMNAQAISAQLVTSPTRCGGAASPARQGDRSPYVAVPPSLGKHDVENGERINPLTSPRKSMQDFVRGDNDSNHGAAGNNTKTSRARSSSTFISRPAVRGNAFSSSIGAVAVTVLPPSAFIGDEAPRLPIILPDPDCVLDFVCEADDDALGAVIGERMYAGVGGRRRQGSTNSANPSLSGSFSEVGSSSSRRRSREPSVTWNNRAMYAEPRCDSRASEHLETSCHDNDPAEDQHACPDARCSTPEQHAAAQENTLDTAYGFSINGDDDVVFPSHNVLHLSPSKASPPQSAGAQTALALTSASLQDGDISLHVGGDEAVHWSEAELLPILASPRREVRTVTVPAQLKAPHASLPLSSAEESLVPPQLQSPIAVGNGSFGLNPTHDVLPFMLPISSVGAEHVLGDSGNPDPMRSGTLGGSTSLDTDDTLAVLGRTPRQIPLRTMPLETATAKPLLRRRGTGISPSVGPTQPSAGQQQ
jgi:hypothetical protein